MEKGQGAEGLLFLLFFVLKLSAHKVLCLSHNGSCKQLGSDTHSARSPFFSSSAGLSGTRLPLAAALHAGRTIQAPLPGSGELAAGISHPGPGRQAGRHCSHPPQPHPPPALGDSSALSLFFASCLSQDPQCVWEEGGCCTIIGVLLHRASQSPPSLHC